MYSDEVSAGCNKNSPAASFFSRPKGVDMQNLLHSLKLTGKAPESRPGPKRKVAKVVFQSSISGAMLVSGRLSSSQDMTANLDDNWDVEVCNPYLSL